MATWTNSTYCICGLSAPLRGHYSTYQVFGVTQSEIRLLNIGKKDALLQIPSEETICAETFEQCRKYRIFNTEGTVEELFVPQVYSLLFVPIFFNEDMLGSILHCNAYSIAVNGRSQPDAQDAPVVGIDVLESAATSPQLELRHQAVGEANVEVDWEDSFFEPVFRIGLNLFLVNIDCATGENHDYIMFVASR